MLESKGGHPLPASRGERREDGLSQRWRIIPLGVVFAAAAAVPLGSQTEDEPIPTDVEERVEVRLAILDVIVLDRRGRTVPDLRPDEFEVTVNGRDVEIASVDVSCPIGEVEDPAADDDLSAAVVPFARPEAAVHPFRVVLGFDFRHFGRTGHRAPVTLVGEIVDKIKETLESEPLPGEETMIVSMGNGLRIETPFTSDRREVLDSVDRVLNDPVNFGGHFDHLTENAFFSEVKALMDVLEAIPGKKAVVLFTGPLGNGFEYDPHFRELAALSATSRVALYPVDSGGLRTEPMYFPGQAGGPKKLARMAVETGGRLTWNTNAVGLGYTRAVRDLACTYEVAFYDNRPRLDRERRVRVWLKRRGIRAYHASSYVFRSPENKRKSLITAAYMAPAMFEKGALEARAFPFRPKSEHKWETLVAVSFPVTEDAFEDGVARWDFGGVIRSHLGTRLRSFNRRVELDRSELTGERSAVVFMERVALRPGRYRLNVVQSHAGMETPLALTTEIELPKIPTGETFLVGPILGRLAGRDVVILGRGLDTPDDPKGDVVRSGEAFEPLLAQRAERGVRVAALTQLCFVGPDEAPGVEVIHRSLSTPGRGVVGTLPPVSVDLDSGRGARCTTLLDWLPTEDLPGGTYSLEAGPDPLPGLGVETVGVGFEIVDPAAPH
jgi:VWFA-related protein